MSATASKYSYPLLDRILKWLSFGSAVVVILLFSLLVLDLLRHGASQISFDFLLLSPEDAGRSGGIASVLVSTLLILLVCLLVSVPIAIGSAAYLVEYAREGSPGRQRAIQLSLDILASVPSIVFGLFGMVMFCQIMGLGFSILAGGLTLACMVLPIILRIAESGFRDLPFEYRQGASALGLSRLSTLRCVVLPITLNSILVGILLGLARALAETAALLFTSGYVTRMPSSLLDSGRSISVHIYDLAMHVPGGQSNAYASALVLIVALLIINALVLRLGRMPWEKGRRE